MFGMNSSNAQVDFTFSTVDDTYCSEGSFMFKSVVGRATDDIIWDFGDGQVASGPNPTIFYTEPGTYPVTMIAVFPERAVRVKKNVTVYPKPEITLSASMNKICQAEDITLNVANSGATPVSYRWIFPDETIETTKPTITKNIDDIGSHNVIVEAITAQNCKVSSQTNINYQLIPVELSIDTSSGCIPITTKLSVKASFDRGDRLNKYEWDFGDGSPLLTNTSRTVNHTYTITDPITTSIKVTSARGCTNSASLSNIAFGVPPTNIDAGTVRPEIQYCGRETVPFRANATNANYYRWDWGDETTDSVKTNRTGKKYEDLGPYSVSVISYFNGCAGDSARFGIEIIGVIGRINYGNYCEEKNKYWFRNASAGNISFYEWTFNHDPNNKVTTVKHPIHTFPRNITDRTDLFIIDSITGCTDFVSKPIYTQEPYYEASTRVACKDSLIIYQVHNNYPEETKYKYSYYSNDSLVSGVMLDTLFFNPANYGLYPDSLIINRNLSTLCKDTIALPGETLVRGPIPIVSMDTLKCLNEPMFFTNDSYAAVSIDTLIHFEWDFGDGKIEQTKIPSPHKFPRAGIYTVKMTATDKNNCRQTKQQNVEILPIPKISVFPIRDTVCLGDPPKMIAGYSVEDIKWSPPLNITCLDCDTSFVTPKQSIAYTATVKNKNGCFNTDSAVFKVYAPFRLQITPPDTAACPPMSVNFRTFPGNLMYNWNSTKYIQDPSQGNQLIFPDSSISYTVFATDSAECFSDTRVVNIKVFDSAHIDPMEDVFVDYGTQFQLSPNYSSNITRFNWSPTGNLNCISCPSPQGIATISQRYLLKGTTPDGCVANSSVNVYLNCEGNLLLPTAFTPNGDGLNDWYYPISFGYKYIQTFIIYDRYGNKVFERKNFQPNVPSLGWNGRYHNEAKDITKSFVYYIEGVCYSNKVISKKGSVILIK